MYSTLLYTIQYSLSVALTVQVLSSPPCPPHPSRSGRDLTAGGEVEERERRSRGGGGTDWRSCGSGAGNNFPTATGRRPILLPLSLLQTHCVAQHSRGGWITFNRRANNVWVFFCKILKE